MLSPKQIMARERSTSSSFGGEKSFMDSPLSGMRKSMDSKTAGATVPENSSPVSLSSSSGSPSSGTRKAVLTSYKSVRGSGYDGRQGILWKEVDPQASHNITEIQQRVRNN